MKGKSHVLLLLISVLTIPVATAVQADEMKLFTFEKVLGIRGMPVVQVIDVERGSTAESLGIKQGDLLVSFDKKDMRGEYAEDWQRFVANLRTQALMTNAILEVLKLELDDTYTPQELLVHIVSTHNDPQEKYFGTPCVYGYLVQEVVTGSLAEKMGVKPNDFINEMNGEFVGNMKGVSDLDEQFKAIYTSPSPEVSLTFMKWGQTDVGNKTGKDPRKGTVNLKTRALSR